MKIQRIYSKIKDTCFLLGPRGVGKSTFLESTLNPDLTINLLEVKVFRELKKNPELLEGKVSHLKKNSLITIDEIQKIPELLNEVHRLIEKKKLRFVLTGSSAKKLRSEGENLLGGRALQFKMFPFSLLELNGKISIQNLIQYGSLPVALGHSGGIVEALESYIETYLKTEIQAEALARNLDEFSQFLEIMGQMNGRILNFESISSAVGKSGDTIKKWISILTDTLLGSEVPSFRPSFKVREVSHSKYYFFDQGVARAAAGLIHEPLDAIQKGFCLETLVLNELKIFQEVKRKKNKISFYQVQNFGEIDFIIETRKKTIDRPGTYVALEVKASQKWKSEYEKTTRQFAINFKNKNDCKMIGIYLGSERLTFGNYQVYPLEMFVQELHEGLIY